MFFFFSFQCTVPVHRFAPETNIYCKPKIEAVLRLGEFIGDKLYEKDYIPLCSCHKTDASGAARNKADKK